MRIASLIYRGGASISGNDFLYIMNEYETWWYLSILIRAVLWFCTLNSPRLYLHAGKYLQIDILLIDYGSSLNAEIIS